MANFPGQPTDINFLSPLGYKLIITKLPNFEYFVQGVKFPQLDLNLTNDLQTPFNKIIIPGDHVTFGQFSVTFKIDENMESYFELYDWIIGIGKPDNFDQYKALASQGQTTGRGVLVNADLLILNGTMNPNIKVTFYDIIPVNISGFDFNSMETDVNYITATATFKYREYTYSRL
jgi:hypothetical protein